MQVASRAICELTQQEFRAETTAKAVNYSAQPRRPTGGALASARWKGWVPAWLVLRTAAPTSGPVSKVSRRQILGMKTRAPTRIVGHARGRPSWGLFFSAWQFHATFTESCKIFQTSSERVSGHLRVTPSMTWTVGLVSG